MLELIFVIVVIGILAVVIVPRMEHNPTYEAGVQLLSHIRYTQHLALVDDQYDINDAQWYLERWQLYFPNAGQAYMIFTDTNKDGSVDANLNYTTVEAAINPADSNRFLIGTPNGTFADVNRLSDDLNLNTQYDIATVRINGGTASIQGRIIFDHLGRIYRGSTDAGAVVADDQITSPTDNLAINAIVIKLCATGAACVNNNQADNDQELAIRIERETGYACILQQGSNVNCMN